MGCDEYELPLPLTEAEKGAIAAVLIGEGTISIASRCAGLSETG